MQSLAVIKHRDVIQNILFCLLSGLVIAPMNPFLFQAREETFSNTVIPTITFSAHAADKMILVQKAPILKWFN
jgi:hypothetical protein